jgi:hypothetical protein
MKSPELLAPNPVAQERAKKLAVLVLFLLSFLWVALLLTSSCVGPRSLPEFEAMPEDQAQAYIANAALIAKVGAHRLLEEGKVRPLEIGAIASVLELAASDPLTLGGPNLITNALRNAGFTDDEILLALSLAEAALREQVSLGDGASPLGVHARLLLSSVAASLRAEVEDR